MDSVKLKKGRALNDFAELVSDWLWEIDENNALVYSNGRLEEAVDAPQKDFVGQNLITILNQFYFLENSSAEDELRRLDTLLMAKKPFSLEELTIKTEGNSLLLLELKAIPVVNKAGQTIGFRGSGHITEDDRPNRRAGNQLKVLMMAVNKTPNGVMITDKEGVIKYINPGFTEITGYSWSETIGKTPSILNSGKTETGTYEDLWRTIQTGESWQGNVYNRRKNGELFWCQETITPVVDKKGAVSNYIAIQKDVTHEVLAQQKLRESQERFKGFTEAASDWYWETDSDLRFSYISETACEYAGMDISEMMGMTRQQLVTQSEDMDFWRGHLEDLANRRPFKDFAYTFIRQDGQRRRWQISGKPYYSDDGRFLGYRGVGQDITVSTELEAQLQQSQKMEVVGHLTGGVAHDFNNLLGIIMGNAELLAEQLEHEKDFRSEKLENIVYAAQRGSKIIKQLLVFARKDTLRPTILDLGSEIEQMLDILKTSLGSSIELRYTSDSDLWQSYADRDQFVNALLNLCINARDAMQEKEQGRLTLSLENVSLSEGQMSLGLPAGHYVLLAVKDNGCGIKEEDKEKVLTPFFSTKETGKGTGLGLSMVYGFAKKSGGAIWLESTVGEGTEVYMYLPRHTIKVAS
ncbi:PAS domain S-box protein [Sneathiella sp.]|uniref:PAS domain-containing sensor histidine kinase n=1 Tax=Sneathiella sp. TaxID=1964365 RepID=UPI0039E28CF8